MSADDEMNAAIRAVVADERKTKLAQRLGLLPSEDTDQDGDPDDAT